jgi:hypothetical protein
MFLGLEPMSSLEEIAAHWMHAFTCSKTLARSTGAVIRVVGTADRKPAVASSAVDSFSLVLLGVKDKISCLEVS